MVRVGDEYRSVMTKVNFGFPDYWRIFKKYGPRLPLTYFLEAHLFDLIHKTNTQTWLPKDCYPKLKTLAIRQLPQLFWRLT
jgi:hypothetical protein